MPTNPSAPTANRWLIAAAIVGALGLGGFANSENLASAGYSADSDGTISRVRADSPAATAGLAVGDRVLAVDGVAYTDIVGRFRRARPAIGDAQRLEVSRDDQRLDVTVTLGRGAGSTLAAFIAGAGVGLVFLIAGLVAHLRRGTGTSRLAALIGLAAMPAFGLIPYLANTQLRIILTVVLGTAGVAIVPMLVDLVLRFSEGPSPRPLVRALLYVPVVLIGLGLALTLFVAPSLLNVLNTVSVSLQAILIVVALVAITVRWRRAAPGPERRARGLLALGLVVGLTPLLVGIFASSMPGASTYFVSVVVIPLAVAHGICRRPPVRLAPPAGRPIEA